MGTQRKLIGSFSSKTKFCLRSCNPIGDLPQMREGRVRKGRVRKGRVRKGRVRKD